MNKNDNILFAAVYLSFLAQMTAYFIISILTIENLYRVTIFFILFVNGFGLMLAVRNAWAKMLCNAMFFLGGYLLYIEFSRPQSIWNFYETWAFIFLELNNLIMSFIIEGIKSKYHG